MGQAESKESDQNPHPALQHARRNTVHGTERSRRPTPPLANPISQRQTEIKRIPTTPGASSPQRLANTPRTFPRSRGLTNVRVRGTPPTAPQRQAATTVRSSGRLQQQFAIRPAKTAATLPSSPIVPTPSRSQPIPISQPSSRARPERAVQARGRGRPAVRRSAPQPKVAAPATDSDQEPAGPPAKRVTRSRTGLSDMGNKTAAGLSPPASITAAAAVAGPSSTKKRPRAAQPLDDEPVRIGDVEPDSADSDGKMSMGTDSDDSDDESDDAASHSSDDSEDPNELHEDLDLGGSDDDNDDKSEASEEKAAVSNEAAGAGSVSAGSSQPARGRARSEAAAGTVSDNSYQPARGRAASMAPVGSQFSLRRSRRRSVPVRHLQVDPHLQSYLFV